MPSKKIFNLQLVKTVVQLLDKSDRRKLIVIYFFMLFTAIIEVIGVGSIIPFISVVSNPESIKSSQSLSLVFNLLSFKDSQQFIIFVGVAVIAFMVFGNATKALLVYIIRRFTFLRIHKLSVKMFRTYLFAPYQFFLHSNTADLLRIIQYEIPNIINGVLTPFLEFLSKLVIIVFLMVLLLASDPLIAILTTLVLTSAYSIIYFVIRKRIDRMGYERYDVAQKSTKSLFEALGGIKDIQLLQREEYYLNNYSEPTRQFAFNNAMHELLSTLPKYLIEVLAFGTIVFVILFYVFLERDFSSFLPTLTLFAFAGYRLMPAIQTVFADLGQLRYFTCSVDVIQSHFNLPCAYELKKNETPPIEFNRQIALEDITFRFKEQKTDLFNNLSLVIPKRHSVAIVGPTGAGKTAMVDILTGLLEPESGSIKVDDTVIDRSNVRAWRAHLGYVAQNIYLCDDTVTHNIAMGIPDKEIDFKAVVEAAKMAHIHDFIESELPQGYNTVIGERGIRLSGGQRQRLGIARALYHNPEVLILDEATSALDTLTEDAVLEAIETLQGEKTIIIIAHRLSTVEKCDTVFLLNHGKIIASGSYAELLKTNSFFRRLARAGQLP